MKSLNGNDEKWAKHPEHWMYICLMYFYIMTQSFQSAREKKYFAHTYLEILNKFFFFFLKTCQSISPLQYGFLLLSLNSLL